MPRMGGAFMRKMDRREFIKVVGAIGASAFIGSSLLGCAQRPEKRPIILGHQADLTGFLAFWGKWHDKAARVAIDLINEKYDGINGRPVQYVVEDTESKVDVATQKLRKLALEDKVDYVLGAVHSGIGIACAPIAKELRVPYSPKGHATAITTTKGNRYVFRMMTNVKSEVRAMANAIKENNLIKDVFGKKWVILYVDYSFGWSHRDEFSAVAEELGIEILDKIAIPPKTKDFVPYLTKIPEETDAIYYLMVGPAESSGMNMQMHELGLTDKPRLTSIASIEGINVDDLADALEGTWIHELMPKNAEDFDTPYYKEFRKYLGLDDYGRDASDPKNHATMKTLMVWEDIFLFKEIAEKVDYKGREDLPKLIKAMEGAEMKESLEHPQGDKIMRDKDHQMFTRTWLSVFENKKLRVKYEIPMEGSIYTPPVDYTQEELLPP